MSPPLPRDPLVWPLASAVVVLWSMIQISQKLGLLSAIWSRSGLKATALTCIQSGFLRTAGGLGFLLIILGCRFCFRDRVLLAAHVVQIEQLGMLGNIAKSGLGFVVLLDQVIPASPFPDDFKGILAGGLELDQAIGLEVRALHGFRPAAPGDGFLLIDHFPTDEQGVAIRELDGVVVRHALFAVVLEIPNEVAIPVEFLKPAARGWALKCPVATGSLGGAEEVAVVEQISGSTAGIVTVPGMNDAAFVVVQVGLLATGVNQVKAGACASRSGARRALPVTELRPSWRRHPSRRRT